MGGDEFVLLLADTEPSTVSERMGDLNRWVEEAGLRVCGVDFLRLSAGTAFFPEDGSDAEELLSKADARMYETKRRHQAEARGSLSLERLAEAVAPGAESEVYVAVNSPPAVC